jgi:hypothetical protein
MSMSRIATFALLLALSGYAQTQPNFTGTWKLNVGKSDFGPVGGPDSRTDVIVQTEGMIKDDVNSDGQQGKISYTLNLKTDGTETMVHIANRDIKISGKWEGPLLVVNQKFDYEGNPITAKNTWTLSSDGNTFTISSHINSPMGEFDQKQVFEKQAGAATSAAAKPMPGQAASGDKPNFSGVWKLNVDKSDFGPLPGPDSETDTIEHNEPNIKLAVSQQSAQGKQEYQLDLAINGKEQAIKMGPRDVKVTPSWEGSGLVVLTKLTFQDMEVTIKSVYTMAPGGKTVNVAAHLASSMGEADQKMVFEKQ